MKPLIETNPYLKDPVLRAKLLKRSAISSCAVEGIIVPENFPHIHIPKRKVKRIYKSK